MSDAVVAVVLCMGMVVFIFLFTRKAVRDTLDE